MPPRSWPANGCCRNSTRFEMRKSNYDKFPFVAAPGNSELLKGWPAIGQALNERLRGRPRAVLVVDTYPGVNDAELLGELESRLKPALTIRTIDLKKTEPELMKLISENLTDDRVFGVMSCHTLEKFFDAERLARSEEHTSELQSLRHLVCRLLLGKK